MILNNTLLRHLPEELQNPKDNFKARRLAFVAERNVRKRAELNHPEDVLDATRLIAAVNDLLEYYGRPEAPPSPGQTFGVGFPGRFDEGNLRWQIRYGLVVPRYLLRNYDNTGKERGPMGGILPAPHLRFNADGHLQDITIQRPHTRQCHRLQWYKGHDFLAEHPDADAVLQAWPQPHRERKRIEGGVAQVSYRTKGIALFTSKQALHVLGVHRLLYATVNWLSMSPTTYHRMRVEVLQRVQRLLQDEEAPPLRFCQNEACQVILPAVGPQRESCSEKCSQQRKNARKWQRRTAKQNGALVEPFPIHPEILSFSFPEA